MSPTREQVRPTPTTPPMGSTRKRRGGRRKRRVLLVGCGSFNPITNMHLRMMELARDAVLRVSPGALVVGVLSPVSDGYRKTGLAPAGHRVEMVRRALTSSDWIKLDAWEAEKSHWLETVHVLRHFKETAGSYFAWSRGNGGSQEEEAEEEDLNGNAIHVRSWCCNGGGSGAYWSRAGEPREEEVDVRLVCGADLLHSFASPGVWNPEHLEEILRDFGVVVCSREGFELDGIVLGTRPLSDHSANVLQVTERIVNDISSTKVRQAVARGESIKYIVQDPVVDYIRENKLYAPCNGT